MVSPCCGHLWRAVKVTAAETHLAPCWEGRGWELPEGLRHCCLRCSPCRRFPRCCHCITTRTEGSLEDVGYNPNYMTVFDILSLLSHMSLSVTIFLSRVTDSQCCECAVSSHMSCGDKSGSTRIHLLRGKAKQEPRRKPCLISEALTESN